MSEQADLINCLRKFYWSFALFSFYRSVDSEETADDKWFRFRLEDSAKCLIVLESGYEDRAGVFDDCTMPVGSERQMMNLYRTCHRRQLAVLLYLLLHCLLWNYNHRGQLPGRIGYGT